MSVTWFPHCMSSRAVSMPSMPPPTIRQSAIVLSDNYCKALSCSREKYRMWLAQLLECPFARSMRCFRIIAITIVLQRQAIQRMKLDDTISGLSSKVCHQHLVESAPVPPFTPRWVMVMVVQSASALVGVAVPVKVAPPVVVKL